MRLVIDNITEQRSRHRAAATNNSLAFFCPSSLSSSFPSSSSSSSRPPRFSAAGTRRRSFFKVKNGTKWSSSSSSASSLSSSLSFPIISIRSISSLARFSAISNVTFNRSNVVSNLAMSSFRFFFFALSLSSTTTAHRRYHPGCFCTFKIFFAVVVVVVVRLTRLTEESVDFMYLCGNIVFNNNEEAASAAVLLPPFTIINFSFTLGCFKRNRNRRTAFVAFVNDFGFSSSEKQVLLLFSSFTSPSSSEDAKVDVFNALTEIRFVFFLESSFLLQRRRDKEDFDAATRMRSKNIKERGFSPLGMVVVVVVVIIAFD